MLKRSYGDAAATALAASAQQSTLSHSQSGPCNILGASLNSSGMSRLPTINSGFGVKSATLEKNLEAVESQAVKNARLKIKKHKILAEKVKVERKLASIEEQKKKIIEDYKARKAGK